MEVSPQARGFSEIHAIEETEETRKRFHWLVEEVEETRKQFQQLAEEEKIKEPIGVCTVAGSEAVLRSLQDDLRKAGYRKLR
jgi:hypothetical protein